MRLARMTTDEVRALLERPRTAAIVPVGSVEPHGPHLGLSTDTVISDRAAERAVALLAAKGVDAVIAPAVPYGVTRYAADFKGAIGVDEAALVPYVAAVCASLLADGFGRVCLVNNHLEPAHDQAVREAALRVAGPDGAPLHRGRVVVACPLTRRWGRTLSAEFKKGNCHAGRYETSLAMAAGEDVRAEYKELPAIQTSLSEGIKAGKATFAQMGLDRAYTGAPAEATREEGEALYEKLGEMIAAEVVESFDRPPHDSAPLAAARQRAGRAVMAGEWAAARAAFAELRDLVDDAASQGHLSALDVAAVDASLAAVSRKMGDADAARRHGEAARNVYSAHGAPQRSALYRIERLVLAHVEPEDMPADRPRVTVVHAGVEHPVRWSQFTIGRSVECDLVISKDTVARLHARIEWAEGGWKVADLNSDNGTWFEGASIRRRAIADGEEYSIGGVSIRVRVSR